MDYETYQRLQIKAKYEYLSKIKNYFCNIRYEIISKQVPSILITSDGDIEYKYSKEVENALKQIDEIEESYVKEMYQGFCY